MTPAAPPAATIAAAPATLTGLAVAALLGAVLSGQVELVAMAAPLAVAAAAGLTRGCAESVEADVSVDRLSTVEGDPVTVSVGVRSGRRIDRLEIAVDADGALGGPLTAIAISVPAGGRETVDLVVACPRWGVGRVRAVVLRWRDAAGVVTRTARADVRAVVRVLPSSQTLRTLVRTDETQIAAGNAVARALGQGMEFGDVRRYAPGDRLHAINWRVTARREGLWVTDRHLERNVDVVLAVDAVLPGTLPAAVRAAVTLTDAYLAGRDRVGLIGIGGTLRWLRPGGGATGRHRVVEELIAAQAFSVEAWGGGFVAPRHDLPPRVFVIALTSLLDDRSAGVLLKLRQSGVSMAVVEIDTAPRGTAADPAATIADKLWRLSRAARRDRLRALGVAVARWREDEPLEAAMVEIAAFRRALRRPAG
jgi:uncharacterized protein (DUF58 family)